MEIDPMMRNFVLYIMGLALIACADSSPVTADTQNTATPTTQSEGLVPLDLSAYGSLVEIMVPARSQQGVDASAQIDDLSGYVTIHAGKNFQIILREEPTTLEDIRQELENEMMWTNTVTPHDEHSILIERALPDGSMSQYHFASVLPGVGSNIVLRSNPMGDFKKKDIERMLVSALTLKTQDGIALNQ